MRLGAGSNIINATSFSGPVIWTSGVAKPLFLHMFFMIGFEDFKLMSWNVRGALSRGGQLFSKELIRIHKPDIIFIVETRCQFMKVKLFWEGLNYFPCYIEEVVGFRGGIWVLKITGLQFSLRLINQHQQAITF